ncbi:MAG TPA: hypothetical protein VLD35_19180 [Caldimonas sp.]|nr:hypothetical protein [Caldimonas sp.]
MSAPAIRLDGWRRVALLAAMAVAALVAGTLVYLVDRPPGHAMWIPHFALAPRPPTFGSIGDWLPSFVHPLAFALLTAAALPAGSPWRYRGCVAWGAVDVACELGQHAALKTAWLGLAEQGLAPVAASRYFLHGRFDVADLVAAAAGALAAAACLHCFDRFKENLHAR